MLTIELGKELEEELEKLAEYEGLSPSECAVNIITEEIDCIKSAKAALEKLEKGDMEAYPIEEVFKDIED